MKLALFYITAGSQEEAELLGRICVEQQLAGCANIFPIQSIFPWQGSLQTENEYVVILKTDPALQPELRDLIISHHSYDIPCIVSFDVEVNDEYGNWIGENVKKNS